MLVGATICEVDWNVGCGAMNTWQGKLSCAVKCALWGYPQYLLPFILVLTIIVLVGVFVYVRLKGDLDEEVKTYR